MFDPEDFRNTKSDLINIISKDLKSGKDLVDAVTTLGQAYGVPFVCIYTYVMEEMPEYTEVCQNKIKQLNEFMGVE